MMDNNIFETNGINLSLKTLETLQYFQENNNDAIQYYNHFLNEITDMLFNIGNDEVIKKTKDEIYELLNKCHSLRKDLSSLQSDK